MKADRDVALVIGAGSGVGLGIAEALCEQGFRLVVADRDGTAADRAAKQLGGDARSVCLDATDREQLGHLADELGKTDRLRVVVTTVAVIEQAPIQQTPDAVWDWAWRNNVMSAVCVADAFTDVLACFPGTSTLVLTGSGASFQIGDRFSDLATYTTTKHALMGYAACLRPALAERGVDLMFISPWGVRGGLAQTSARYRTDDLGHVYDPDRARQPEDDRVLQDPFAFGQLVVAGIAARAKYVHNRPELYVKDMHDFVDDWDEHTRAALVRIEAT